MTNRIQKLVEKIAISLKKKPIDVNRIKMTVEVFMQFKEAEQLSELQKEVLSIISQMLQDAETCENSNLTDYVYDLFNDLLIDLYNAGLIDLFED